jgi:hypothetical protein
VIEHDLSEVKDCGMEAATEDEAATGTPCEEAATTNNRIFKVLRFMKLSKMLRLARLKKLMMKYEQSFTFNQYLGVMLINFSILFLSHLLACFWQMVGFRAPACTCLLCKLLHYESRSAALQEAP